MKKITLAMSLMLVLLVSSHSGFSKEEIITSHKLSSALNIDGSPEDWKDLPMNLEKKVDVDYAFQNDGETLFILFVFKDPQFVSSIDATGMTVWFNTEGKQKRDYGITFLRMRISADFYISYLEKQQGPLTEAEKQKIRANPFYNFNSAEVINKRKDESAEPSESGQAPPAVFRADKKGQMLVYEFAVPLARAAEDAPGIGTEAGQVVKVGFEWGGLTDEMRKKMLDRQVGREEGARLSEIDSGGRVGGTGSSAPKKYSFWADVQLAQK